MSNSTTSAMSLTSIFLHWAPLDFATANHVSIPLVLLASILFFVVKLKSKTFQKNKRPPLPPGPTPWPVIGSLPELLRNKPAFRWIERLLAELNTEIACIRLGNVHVIPVISPEIAREFLKDHDAVFASRPLTMATDYASRGFLTIAVVPWGEQWKKMRRLVTSEVVSPARLRWLLGRRTEEADNIVRFIYNQCKKSPVNDDSIGSSVINLRITARQFSGNIVRQMLFNKRYLGEGKEDGGPGIEELEHVDSLFRMVAHIYAFCVSDFIPCLRRVVDLDGHEKTVKEAMRILDKYHNPIIEERIQQWKDGKKREPEDLLDVLISMKDPNGGRKPLLSVDEIKAQCTELMFAIVDNPPNSVEWAMAEMINKPEILQKAVNEIDRVVGKERLVQESDIPQLNYVKACAREAMRLHPIAPFNLAHYSISDAIVAGYFIPKGSHVILSRRGLGRNPKVWEEPLSYIPERHLKDGSGQVDLTEPELRFISFSTGRRGCMGSTLGTAMTVMMLSRLVQGFAWSVPPNEKGIDLSESRNDLTLAKPLHALATPRLQAMMYPAN